MALVSKILETTLTAGSTAVTFTDADIPNSLIRVFSSNSDVIPESRLLSGNTLTVTYAAQSSNMNVALEIVKQGLDIVDNVTSTDTDKALSAKQGKVLKDAIDGLDAIVSGLEIPENITDLDDVNVTSIQDGQVLAWDDVSQKFINTTPEVSGGVVYSSDEQLIGSYFNENLYQRTIKKPGVSRVTTSTILLTAAELAALNIDTTKIKYLSFILKYTITGYDPLVFSQNFYLNSTNLMLLWCNAGAVYYWAQWGTNTSVNIDIDITVKYTK